MTITGIQITEHESRILAPNSRRFRHQAQMAYSNSNPFYSRVSLNGIIDLNKWVSMHVSLNASTVSINGTCTGMKCSGHLPVTMGTWWAAWRAHSCLLLEDLYDEEKKGEVRKEGEIKDKWIQKDLWWSHVSQDVKERDLPICGLSELIETSEMHNSLNSALFSFNGVYWT